MVIAGILIGTNIVDNISFGISDQANHFCHELFASDTSNSSKSKIGLITLVFAIFATLLYFSYYTIILDIISWFNAMPIKSLAVFGFLTELSI